MASLMGMVATSFHNIRVQHGLINIKSLQLHSPREVYIWSKVTLTKTSIVMPEYVNRQWFSMANIQDAYCGLLLSLYLESTNIF
jgi:hypothetical protein